MKTITVFALVITIILADTHYKKDHDDHHEHHDKRENGKLDNGQKGKAEDIGLNKSAQIQKDKNGESRENKDNVGELKNMEMEGLIPNIIKTLPTKPLSVTFEKNQVQFGNELTLAQVKNPPKITWPTEKDALYTLTMFDIDAPNKKAREVIHWLVVNIPGDDIAKGETVVPFLRSAPAKGSGLHRYVFLLFKQPKKITPASKQDTSKPDHSKLVEALKIGGSSSRDQRFNLKVGQFVEKYGLGDAVGGNFYKTQSDEGNRKRSN